MKTLAFISALCYPFRICLHRAYRGRRIAAARAMVVSALEFDTNSFREAWTTYAKYRFLPVAAADPRDVSRAWREVLDSDRTTRDTLIRWWHKADFGADAMSQVALAACCLEGVSGQRAEWVRDSYWPRQSRISRRDAAIILYWAVLLSTIAARGEPGVHALGHLRAMTVTLAEQGYGFPGIPNLPSLKEQPPRREADGDGLSSDVPCLSLRKETAP